MKSFIAKLTFYSIFCTALIIIVTAYFTFCAYTAKAEIPGSKDFAGRSAIPGSVGFAGRYKGEMNLKYQTCGQLVLPKQQIDFTVYDLAPGLYYTPYGNGRTMMGGAQYRFLSLGVSWQGEGEFGDPLTVLVELQLRKLGRRFTKFAYLGTTFLSNGQVCHLKFEGILRRGK